MANEEENAMDSAFRKFLVLFIIGFIMIFVGIIVMVVAAAIYDGGTASFGAVIFIGPIPIVVGAGPEATLMVILAIILAALSIIVFFVFKRGIGKAAP